MLKSFIILDLPMDASDAQIRERYLKLVKVFSPEKSPEKFQKITDAYEAIKNKRFRIKAQLDSALHDREGEQTLRFVADFVKLKKRDVCLDEMLKALD